MYDQAAKTEAPEATFNDRLNRVAEGMQAQCERIGSVLSRINGTPEKPPKGTEVAQIRPVHALSQCVKHLEEIHARLTDLANGVERIA